MCIHQNSSLVEMSSAQLLEMATPFIHAVALLGFLADTLGVGSVKVSGQIWYKLSRYRMVVDRRHC